MKKSIVFLCLLAFSFVTNAQVITSPEIDALVEKTLKTFDVPGMAVAVVKDGRVIHAKGYGVRSLNTKEKVNENTLFGIASNSKAFTAAALGMLMDEKKLTWDTKVNDIIPEFKMYNPYVTEEFTVRDLLTHRSGLGLGAGDLMFWPDQNNFTKKDIIYNLRFLKPVSGFRTKYDYDNLLYIVAGEVVTRVSGMPWEEFIETRILKPLEMNQTAASFKRLKDKSNVIDPHAPVEGTVKVIRRDWSEVANAAGGIYSNVTDMSKWIIMQMDNGQYGDGKQLFSSRVHEEMWTPQTVIPVRGTNSYNTHYSSYGLGWFLSDVKGYKQATHTGGLAGIVTQVTLLPELKLGIIVFTNQQSGAAFTAVTNTIKDSYLGIKGIDRVKENHDRVLANEAEAKKITSEIWAAIETQQKNNASKTDPNLFVGTYRDPWFGEVVISLKNGKLWFDSKRSFQLTGELLPYKGNTLIVKWTERSMDADAYVMFELDNEGKASGFKMKAISPLTDFSFDFHDLDFKVK
ncbi:serine hydrolase [Runella slithyformis]|uniref:Beta-lactamase n=1 Tax=Runella slithyformis (strain ATCC 29530 / DSM 19594 / LMG 11500 / NCIMB 11436 / LSU 4) TaxID=761193 RepID=A0A7U3ZQS0_RUNSL|nr:serine hydrolase [Runella slithyformis]AEI51637.1 beta-lactamase [Runella slithyformis DSM 19594]